MVIPSRSHCLFALSFFIILADRVFNTVALAVHQFDFPCALIASQTLTAMVALNLRRLFRSRRKWCSCDEQSDLVFDPLICSAAILLFLSRVFEYNLLIDCQLHSIGDGFLDIGFYALFRKLCFPKGNVPLSMLSIPLGISILLISVINFRVLFFIFSGSYVLHSAAKALMYIVLYQHWIIRRRCDDHMEQFSIALCAVVLLCDFVVDLFVQHNFRSVSALFLTSEWPLYMNVSFCLFSGAAFAFIFFPTAIEHPLRLLFARYLVKLTVSIAESIYFSLWPELSISCQLMISTLVQYAVLKQSTLK